MERRRQPVARRRTGSLVQTVAAKNSEVLPAPLPNLAELITYGEITIGVLRPVGCVATATDEDNCLAMLKRRRGETLAQLLNRLDQAVERLSLKTSTPTKSIRRPAIPELRKCPHHSFVDTYDDSFLLSIRSTRDAYGYS